MKTDSDECLNLWESLDVIKKKSKKSTTEKGIVLLFDILALVIAFIIAPLLVALPLSHTFHLGNIGMLAIWMLTLFTIHFAGKGIRVKRA